MFLRELSDVRAPGGLLRFMHCRKALRDGGDRGLAPFLQPLRPGEHLFERQIRTPRNHQTRVLPNREIVFGAVARIADGEIERQIAAIGWSGEFEFHLLLRHERGHRILPACGGTGLADVPDGSEAPERLLPGFHIRHRERSSTDFFTETIQQQRGFRVGEGTLEDGEVFGVQTLRAALALKRREVFCQRQPHPRIRVELDPMKTHRGRAAGCTEWRIEGANLCQRLVGPVSR